MCSGLRAEAQGKATGYFLYPGLSRSKMASTGGESGPTDARHPRRSRSSG